MNITFENKTVLITGATRGIGAEIALSFLQSKANVIITGTSDDSYKMFNEKYLVDEFKNKIFFVAVDLCDESQIYDLKNKISAPVDILVNCAGINKVDKLEDINLNDWQNIQDVNLKAPFLLSQIFSKKMIENNWGRIINISSVFGVVSKEKRLSYSCSKFALVGLTKALALELARHNVLVNAVSPGFIDTELTRRVLGESGIKEMVSQVPINRLGEACEIAKIVVFLASVENSFITGQNIIADGGFTCG